MKRLYLKESILFENAAFLKVTSLSCYHFLMLECSIGHLDVKQNKSKLQKHLVSMTTNSSYILILRTQTGSLFVKQCV